MTPHVDADEGFAVRRLEVADAEAIASWRYPGRCATYDVREVVTPGQGSGRSCEAAMRLLILGWNDRSRKVAEALGFQHRGDVPSKEGTFLLMVRETT